jgi:serine/threonine protein phosphatase PrpC
MQTLLDASLLAEALPVRPLAETPPMTSHFTAARDSSPKLFGGSDDRQEQEFRGAGGSGLRPNFPEVKDTLQTQLESAWKMLHDTFGHTLSGNMKGFQLFSSCSKVPRHSSTPQGRMQVPNSPENGELTLGCLHIDQSITGDSLCGEGSAEGSAESRADIDHQQSAGPLPRSFVLRTSPLIHASAQSGGARSSVVGYCDLPSSQVSPSATKCDRNERRRTLAPQQVGDVLMRHQASICSMKGTKSTAPNQDRAIFGTLGNGALQLVGVFDGHGEHGHFVAGLCSELLPKLLIRALVRASPAAVHKAMPVGDPNPQDAAEDSVSWRDAGCHAFLETHRILEEITQQFVSQTATESDSTIPLIDARSSGATATVVLWTAMRAFVAHTGDSRAVLGTRPRNSVPGARWQVVELTQDHKPDLPDEQARIEDAGAQVLCSGHPPNEVLRVYTAQQTWPMINMTRSLGDLHAHTQGLSAEPEIRIADRLWDPSEEAVLLVCSDGIWDVISSADAVDLVCEQRAAGLDPAVGLAQEAFLRWGQRGLPNRYSDDITVIVKFC